MNLFNFTKKEPRDTIDGVLARDSIQKLLDEYKELHLAKSRGLILIWVTNNDICIDNSSELKEAEIIYCLGQMMHDIQHQGAPRRK